MTLEKRLKQFLQNNKNLIGWNEDNCFYKYNHVVIVINDK